MSQLSARPLVCLITEGKLTPENFEISKADVLAVIREAASSKIPLVQIRERSLTASMLFQLCTDAVAICSGSRTRVIVNDRLDIAMSSCAAGVHLPSHGLPAKSVRRRVSEGFLVGVSAHSVDDVISARAAGADYAFFSPVFDSPGKGPAVGIESLRECTAAAGEFPVIALGGINASNYHSVLTAGAAGFAAIRFLNNAANIRTIGSEYLEQTNEQHRNNA